MWVKEAKLECEIGRLKTAMELAEVIAYCQKKKFTAYKIKPGKNGSVLLTADADPFVQVADMLQAPKEYKSVLADMDNDFVKNIIKEVKMTKSATAKFNSYLAKGAKKSEIEINLK